MNAVQRLYYAQARSDWELFNFLSDANKPVGHCLHYLQMATEKLGKAGFRESIPPKVHTGFSKFFRNLSSVKGLPKALGFPRLVEFQDYLSKNHPLTRDIEKLAPHQDCAGSGPNPEYPWPPYPDAAVHAPVDYNFPCGIDSGRTRASRSSCWSWSGFFGSFPNSFE